MNIVQKTPNYLVACIATSSMAFGPEGDFLSDQLLTQQAHFDFTQSFGRSDLFSSLAEIAAECRNQTGMAAALNLCRLKHCIMHGMF